MGYTTDFRGQLSVTPALTPEQLAFITAFNETQRMGRDPKVVMEYAKGEDGLPGADKTNAEEVYGKFGEYYVGDNSIGVIDNNAAPGQSRIFGETECQPGLWCQWTVYADDEQNQTFEWDGGEKFYEYVKWLEYMVKFFFTPWGVMLNGTIEWRGEEWDDNGVITVENNVITVKE